MEPSIKCLILAVAMAFCLLVMPALSVSSNQSTSLVLLVQHSGSGFAINGSEFHVLKVGILGIAELDPAKIDNLISDNKTLGQIKSEIKDEVKSEMDAASYNGSLLLDDDIFELSNITSRTTDDNNSTIDADILNPAAPVHMNNSTMNSSAAVIGNISLRFTIHENSLVGMGRLTMDMGNYSGKYDALLLLGSCKFGKEMRHCKVRY
ncbi:MAG: hypothetical protein ACE14P_14895 [Methanotrichaceae archaeon]